jgi:hypothetical protein
MRLFLVLGCAAALMLLQPGCFVIRPAVVGTVKVGAYAAKKTAQVAVKATVKTGKVMARGAHRAVDAAASSSPEPPAEP